MLRVILIAMATILGALAAVVAPVMLSHRIIPARSSARSGAP